MKLVKTANGKEVIKISKADWETTGKRAGWFKIAEEIEGNEGNEEMNTQNTQEQNVENPFKNPYYFIGANPTVDLVVLRRSQNGSEVLLIKRKPGGVEGGKWALPGGFINTDAKQGEEWRAGAESPEQAAKRETKEETGLNISIPIVPIGVFEGSGRDPRDNDISWSKSYAFSVQIPEGAGNNVRGMDDAQEAGWFSLNKLPSPLAFDHIQIIKAALSQEK